MTRAETGNYHIFCPRIINSASGVTGLKRLFSDMLRSYILEGNFFPYFDVLMSK